MVYVATAIMQQMILFDLQAVCSSFYMECQWQQLTSNLEDIKKYLD
jgi:hypothetical protein